MAEVTPRKRACCSVELLCRCCGVKTETNRRIYLFGKDDGILEAIKEFAGREISEDDEFSKYVCRSCTTKILTIKKKVNQFRELFIHSENLQRNIPKSERFKRGRKLEVCFDNLESQNRNVKRTRVQIAAVFQRSLSGNCITGFSRDESQRSSINGNDLACLPQQSTVSNNLTCKSPRRNRRVLAARFQQVAPKRSTVIASNMNIQSLNNLQNEPTVGKAKRLLPVCMQKQQPKQKGEEAIEIVENFGLHSAMVRKVVFCYFFMFFLS